MSRNYTASRQKMRIAFVHPDLGIGGAERLVVDAALSLKELDHEPVIYTAHQDLSRTFPEVSPPSQLIPVQVVRTPFPLSLFGRLHAFLAALRCTFIAFYVCLFCKLDVAIVDIVSLPVMVFALFGKPVLFYCHFPDKLLAQTLRPGLQSSKLKRVYRSIIDRLEAMSLRFATAIVCNSRFTKRAFQQVFPKLRSPAVIYPCVAVPEQVEESQEKKEVLLSINRYERKKSISLAIETLSVIRDRLSEAKHIRLVIAGGYDKRLRENVEYFEELRKLVTTRELNDRVTLLQNIDDEERCRLMKSALAVLYTPSNEHFGIVPLEAMAQGVAVVAVNSGGATESLEDGVTGILCESSANAFAEAVIPWIRNPEEAKMIGRAGRNRVTKYFSRHVLGQELQNILAQITNR